jgi:hypothetical protein
MATQHHAPERAIRRETKMAPLASGLYLPLIGTMLTTIGLLLVIGGLMVVPSPAIATRRGWLPTQDVDAKAAMAPRPMPLGRAWAYPSAQASSSQESIKGGSRWMSRRVSSVIPAPTKTRMPDALEPASSTCRPLRHDSDDRIANALFPDGIEPSVPGIVRSDLQQQVRNPRSYIGTGADSAQKAELPLCEDPRFALAMMASAQRRGTEPVGTRQLPPSWFE